MQPESPPPRQLWDLPFPPRSAPSRALPVLTRPRTQLQPRYATRRPGPRASPAANGRSALRPRGATLPASSVQAGGREQAAGRGRACALPRGDSPASAASPAPGRRSLCTATLAPRPL